MLQMDKGTNKLLEDVKATTREFFLTLSRQDQKVIGQFTTPEAVADYMATRLIANWVPSKTDITILDPGAGTGVLSIALLDQLFAKYPQHRIVLAAYENDSVALRVLRQNLEKTQEWAVDHGHTLAYTIHGEDYILDHSESPTDYVWRNENTYDLVIANPPYKKMSKASPEAQAMDFVVYGAPNLYGFFWAKSAIELKKNGVSTFLIPRSWMSGAYFQRMRQFMLKTGSIIEIHSFEDRNSIFGATKILQELVIVVFAKKKADHIRYWHLASISQLTGGDGLRVPAGSAVVGPEKRVYNVATANYMHALKWANSLQSTFSQSGLKMKTGLTVGFRNRALLSPTAGTDKVPIFFADNFNQHTVQLGRQGDQYISKDHPGFLQPNIDYIFVKRFSTKEERRRVQTAYYDPAATPGFTEISTDNKLNFVVSQSEAVLQGAFLVLSSTQFDDYYRLLNGNTQVNSTEINSMRFPTAKQLEQLAARFSKAELVRLSQIDIDGIVGTAFPG